jgi:hypothetical protein
VGIPLSADTPAPVRTTIREAKRRAEINGRGSIGVPSEFVIVA